MMARPSVKLDLVQRLREGRKDGTALRWQVTDVHREAASEIESLRARLAEVEGENARLAEEKHAVEFAARNGCSLAEDAIHAIRQLLNDAGVPLAAFIDDHVANAVVQRNQERETVRGLRKGLEPFAALTDGGRGSALSDDAPLAVINAAMPDLPQWIAKAKGVITQGDLRRARSLTERRDG